MLVIRFIDTYSIVSQVLLIVSCVIIFLQHAALHNAQSPSGTIRCSLAIVRSVCGCWASLPGRAGKGFLRIDSVSLTLPIIPITYALPIYSPVSGLIFILSPVFINRGTFTFAPVSTMASFVAFWAVLPFTASEV